jgi:uncharacterized protein (TIGR03000 family)
MLKRYFPVVSAAALVLVLASAGSSRAQFFGFGGGWGGWGGMSPWSGTGNWYYWPGGIGINYMPGIYYGGGYYGNYPNGVINSMYGMPTSVGVSPMTYVAFYPPVYTTRAPVVAPAEGLLPANMPATVEVIAPPGAVLRFDGKPTSQIGTYRTFSTPPLVKGQSYHYDVEAEFTQDGKRVTQKQRVGVYAGGSVTIAFPTGK